MNILYRNPCNYITGRLIQETLTFKFVNTFWTSYEGIKMYTLFLFIIVQLLNALCNIKFMVLSLIRLSCTSQNTMCTKIKFVLNY